MRHFQKLALCTADTFAFEVVHTSKTSGARAGVIHTAHGSIETPNYIAVGTNAALKGCPSSMAAAEGLQMMFCNTYHLILHPGADIIADAGGLHRFMNWDKPIITDSGGFQIFSLAYGSVFEEVHSLKRSRGQTKEYSSSLVQQTNEEGATFKSYRDGTSILLTPEASVNAQKKLGADIILPLDILPPYHYSYDNVKESLHRSHRWMARSYIAHERNKKGQAMYGILHGGMSLTLRRDSAAFLREHNFDGHAIGGALGKNREELLWLMKKIVPMLPSHKPIHVLGIADPFSIPKLVPLGCDTFDSAYATRVGRHGSMLTDDGLLRINAGTNKSCHRKPIEDCECFTCQNHSLSYLHHLVKAKEPLATTLLSLHNIHYMCSLMSTLREKILKDEI